MGCQTSCSSVDRAVVHALESVEDVQGLQGGRAHQVARVEIGALADCGVEKGHPPSDRFQCGIEFIQRLSRTESKRGRPESRLPMHYRWHC